MSIVPKRLSRDLRFVSMELEYGGLRGVLAL